MISSPPGTEWAWSGALAEHQKQSPSGVGGSAERGNGRTDGLAGQRGLIPLSRPPATDLPRSRGCAAQAKRAALAQAERTTGSFAGFDSQYGNYLLPVIPAFPSKG
mmetsp:Transcript_10215/g.24372  ORF Transcript_10215/g.24372 Transcript_10215/m.24372 type:complete len:106 (+) Transcript_10215:779-1096(+)